MSASYGSASIWGSPNYLTLTSEESPFESGPISEDEASLVVSIPCFGAVFGTMFYSVVIGKYGRKLLLLSIAIIQIVILFYFLIFKLFEFSHLDLLQIRTHFETRIF